MWRSSVLTSLVSTAIHHSEQHWQNSFPSKMADNQSSLFYVPYSPPPLYPISQPLSSCPLLPFLLILKLICGDWSKGSRVWAYGVLGVAASMSVPGISILLSVPCLDSCLIKGDVSWLKCFIFIRPPWRTVNVRSSNIYGHW